MKRHALLYAAVVFAVTYLATLFGFLDLPEGKDTDAHVRDLLAGEGNAGAGAACLAVSGLAFLVVLSGVVSHVRQRSTALASLAQAAGTCYAAMLFVAAAAWGGLPLAVAMDELPEDLDPAFYRVFTQFGFVALLIFGLLSAAVLVFVTSLAGRGGNLPRWFVSTGFVIAPLLLLGAIYLPQVLVPAWALCAAVAVPAREAETGLDASRSG